MRFLFAAILAASVGASAFAAEDDSASELTKLMTAYDARGWEGVGRLNIGFGGMCTGALIAPDLVLTAGHCLYSANTGDVIDPSLIEFHAGWRNGRASASRKIRRAVVHPDYEYVGPTAQDASISVDLALLQLDSAIRLAHIQPFPTGKRPRKGAQVGVVSYARNRSDSPSIQEVCHVLARRQGTLVLSCDVDFGSSGAPIFAEVDGKPQIVSVVSAMGEVRGRPISLGTNLEKPLAQMMALLQTGNSLAARGTPNVKTVRPDGPRTMSGDKNGAKFLRP